MAKRFSIVIIGLLSFFVYDVNAQQSETVESLLNLEEDRYFVDRDSAFEDPYYGIKKLIYGNKRFAENKSILPRRTDEVLEAAAMGQSPFATIIGCSDSRVPNEIIFDQGIGDIFVTRTAGQVMAEASYGTIEYSTQVLETKLIVVLGHEKCGAVDAAMKLPKNPPAHVATLINAIKPVALVKHEDGAMEKAPLDMAIRKNVLRQVELLRTLEPVLSDRYNQGEILIVGAIYDLNTGHVEFLEETIANLPRYSDESAMNK